MADPMSEERLNQIIRLSNGTVDPTKNKLALELCAEVGRLQKELADLRVFYRRQYRASERLRQTSGSAQPRPV